MMNYQTFPLLFNKTTWGDGPWQDEPDRVEWIDEATGYACLARRGSPRAGAWCGYVGIRPGHPFYERHYSGCVLPTACVDSYCEHGLDNMLSVHGGITYAAECDIGDGTGICHTPAPGEPEDLWWLGFDCHHFMDLAPGMEAFEKSVGMDRPASMVMIYRDLAFVQEQCADLAQQLLAVAQRVM